MHHSTPLSKEHIETGGEPAMALAEEEAVGSIGGVPVGRFRRRAAPYVGRERPRACRRSELARLGQTAAYHAVPLPDRRVKAALVAGSAPVESRITRPLETVCKYPAPVVLPGEKCREVSATNQLVSKPFFKRCLSFITLTRDSDKPIIKSLSDARRGSIARSSLWLRTGE